MESAEAQEPPPVKYLRWQQFRFALISSSYHCSTPVRREAITVSMRCIGQARTVQTTKYCKLIFQCSQAMSSLYIDELRNILASTKASRGLVKVCMVDLFVAGFFVDGLI
jgi:hypothetical protein